MCGNRGAKQGSAARFAAHDVACFAAKVMMACLLLSAACFRAVCALEPLHDAPAAQVSAMALDESKADELSRIAQKGIEGGVA